MPKLLRGPPAPRAVRLPRVVDVRVVVSASDRKARTRSAGATVARRALLIGLLAYVALQFGFRQAVLADALPVADPIWGDKLATLQARPTPPTLLALGSSRTQLAFDATAFTAATGSDSFNFGTPAGGPATCNLYLRRLLAAGHRPQTILLELHPGFLHPGEPPFEARWLHPYRLRGDEPDRLRSFGWTLPDPPQHGWRGHLAATSVWRMGLLNEAAPVWLPCPFGLTPTGRGDARGWVPGIDLPPAERATALRRTFTHYADVLTRYDVGGPGCEAVRDTLALCRAHGIRGAVLLAPESSEHRGWYGEAGSAKITAFAASLGVPVIDARDWLPDALIADGHHLTPDGARAFTGRLAAEWGRGGWAK